MSQHRRRGAVSTFSEMAEEWVRENMHTTEVPRTATKATEGMLDHDPAAWRADFNLWMVENCIRREAWDDSGGLGCLHLHFCEWAIAHNSVPCTRAIFEQLVLDAGFRVEDGMVLRLLLRKDFGAVMHSQATPEEGWMPARANAEQRMPARREDNGHEISEH
jgi:hypothetical protein